MNNLQSNRKEYIDIAKGIGIILVVFGHCPMIFNPIKQCVYAFHMPLFFIISGMVWNNVRHKEKGFFNRSFLFGKIQRLIIPCFFWGFIYCIISAIKNDAFSIKSILYIMYGSQSGFLHAGSLTSLWFLPCMFLTVCCFELIQMCLKNKEKKVFYLIVVSILSATIGLFLPRIKGGYPWSIDVAFIALAFMIWGNLGIKPFEKIVNNGWRICLTTVVCLLILVLTYGENLKYIEINNADLAGRYLGNVGLYFVDAVSGGVLTLSLSYIISKKNTISHLLCRIGRHTIPILILHKPIVQMIDRVLFNSSSITNGIKVLIEVVISIAICEILYSVLKRFFPLLIGE